MPQFTYTPDSDLKVHEEGAIKLICQSFRSHENGIPEWCKNSSDAYIRENIPQERRTILIIFNNGKGTKLSSISCLDFVGITSDQIDKRFRYWADPEAATGGLSITNLQGGHGNGGKCYMTQMFEDHAALYSVRNGKGNNYGVESGSFRFGYIPSPEKGKDFAVSDQKNKLNSTLSMVGTKIQDLPELVQEGLDLMNGFTLVIGVKPREINNKIPVQELIDNIINHQQMILTLQLCKVYVIVDGKKYNQGKPLSLPEIPPIEGASEPKIIVIPEILIDPKFDHETSTTKIGKYAQGTLILRTSDKSMRWQRKYRHSIVYRAISGYIGNKDIPALGVQSAYADKIYGDCLLDSLEDFKTNERTNLVDSPLTRSVESWIRKQIDSYAHEFELKEKRKIDQVDKGELNKMNAALDKWKNKFLENMIETLWGGSGIGGSSKTISHLPSGKSSRLELTLSHNRAGVGVTIKPVLKFYDKKGQKLRSVPYRWISDDTNVAMIDESLLTINTYSFGKTEIYAETLDGKLKSNPVQLEVVHLYGIQIVPETLEITSGSKNSLTAICTLASGEQTSDVYLV